MYSWNITTVIVWVGPYSCPLMMMFHNLHAHVQNYLFAANLLSTVSQIIDYKYYAQPQVPYQSEGEHYHAYRSSTPLFTSPARWLSKLTRGGPIPYHYSCSEIHLQRHTNPVTSETGTYRITRLGVWTREQQISRSLHRRLNTKITFEHKEQYHN